MLLSAGAPVRPTLLAAAVELMPNAEAHTPYGMTEVLPVASISLSELVEVSTEPSLRGVCVGGLAPGVEVEIEPFEGAEFGEVLVSAAHGKRSYDRLWFTEQRTRRNGWHRTGDVGSLDETGRLWIGGRLEHVIETMDGPIMPVGLEQAVEQLEQVERAAAVGVGPAGSHVVVMVVERWDGRGNGLAEAELTTAVRDAVSGLAPIDVAAVLCASRLPVDKRHNSKVDRRRLARWAERVLAGGRIGSP
jgi:acyl-coenzyme A synthetase/AMP-(fatty) acid ligase